MNTRFVVRLLLAFAIASLLPVAVSAQNPAAPDHAKQVAEAKKKIKHIVVIYEENWSFDGLFGKFPGANNIDSAIARNQYLQDSVPGVPYKFLPIPKATISNGEPYPNDARFNQSLPNKPFDLADFKISTKDLTGDITHRFYTQQKQINGGKMNMFAALSENGGLAMSYFNSTELPETKLATEYTLCDNFFHSAFGGSFLNHQWLIAARTPVIDSPLQKMITVFNGYKATVRDNVVDTSGHFAINTIYSANGPQPELYKKALLQSQNYVTIGDRMDAKKIKWAWYSEGWNDRLAGKPDPEHKFQYHHQPFVYFDNYKAEGNINFKGKRHLKDEEDLATDLKNKTLPQVCFYKALGDNDEHPGSAELLKSQQHVKKLVDMILADKEYGEETAIIITFDENGGRWDHVAPPVIDMWGPGARVPTIIIGKYAKKHFIDKTQYETVSILKLIETLYGLEPLNSRDANANDLLNAFDFSQQ